MITPTLSEFLTLARQGKRVPLRRRIPADLETPVSAFLKLKPRGAAFLLESVEQGLQVGRYSFIGASPYATVTLQDGTIVVEKGGGSRRLPMTPADPFSFIREELSNSGGVLGDDLPGPFAGAVGYISFDMAQYFEKIPAHRGNGLGLPGFYFTFPGTLATFDHARSQIEILTLPPQGDPAHAYAVASEEIDSLLEALESPLPRTEKHDPPGNESSVVSNMTETAFKDKVSRAIEHIYAGDVFQVVLSQRLQGRTGTPPFKIYRALRILNPSPYMFFLDLGEFQLIGSSPEMLVKLEKGKATLCPIAGTRPRGASPSADQDLERELISNEKERAEHTMLVDLGRNDLGRVCEVGSVATESFMHVEKYSHVMHLVSRVKGRLRSDLDMFDLLRATFPAGTVTGAPKIRAMQLISDLEEDPRGPYAGAVGYFGRQGDMDMCIAIRTLIMRGSTYFAQAGAGIVADSDPACEFQETLHKIKALTRAICIAEEGF